MLLALDLTVREENSHQHMADEISVLTRKVDDLQLDIKSMLVMLAALYCQHELRTAEETGVRIGRQAQIVRRR